MSVMSLLMRENSAAPVLGELIPRPEYPQPQFQRTEWMSLNGSWEFECDDENAGLDEGWWADDVRFGSSILVPYSVDSPLSGFGDATPHPCVWYRRRFTVPDEWELERLLLHAGAVDYRATFWVNGQFAGQHEGGQTPCRFEIGALLADGPNTVTVRAEAPEDCSRTKGIWQSVWLEPVGDSYLDRVKVDATLDGTVTFAARIARSAGGLQFCVTVKCQGRTVAVATAQSIGSRAAAVAVIRDPKLWSPGSPDLYDVTYELRRGGQVLDRVQSYFGFRSITMQDGKLLLNGNPTDLKMVPSPGCWAESDLTAPSDEAIREDIRLTRELGFNGVRTGQRIEDPRYFYWADRMGLLVSAEMPATCGFDESDIGRVTHEWIEAVLRDYNHPSIILWVVQNATDVRQQALLMLTKSLDPARPVMDDHAMQTECCIPSGIASDCRRPGQSSESVSGGAPASNVPGNRAIDRVHLPGPGRVATDR